MWNEFQLNDTLEHKHWKSRDYFRTEIEIHWIAFV